MVIILNGMHKVVKTEDQKLFEGKERKSFFKSEEERNLWIRLNAEHIRYSNKVLNRNYEQDLGDINKPYSPMWISINQLTYDEYMRDAPRHSFEEFLMLSEDEMFRLARKKNQDVIKELFQKFFGEL
jgi:hypothetical protein